MIKLSVIIPTRNRAKLLAKTLMSIEQQTMLKEEFEVIVIDNGSTDETPKVLAEFSDRMNVQSIFEPQPGLHVGRHSGLFAAKANELVFIDDDIEAFPIWLQTISNVFLSDKKIALVGGKNLPNYETPPPFWILELWNKGNSYGNVLEDLSVLDFGDNEREISPYYVFGCNFSVRKEIILKAGGFHPDGFPFDKIRYRGDGETHISDFVRDSNCIAYYHPGASVKHWVPTDRMTEEYFCKRRYMQGISAAYSQLRSGNMFKRSNPDESSKFKRYIKSILGSTRIEMLNELSKTINKTDFERRLNRSYMLGKEYLLDCYRKDESIRKWVHQNDYF